MKDFIKIWKEKAHNKSIECHDVVAYCVLKTIKAKSENKKEILEYFLNKCFSPHKQNGYDKLRRGARTVGSKMLWNKMILDYPIEDIIDNEEEKELFEELLKVAENYYG